MCFGLYASWNYHPAWGAQSLSCHGFKASFESLDTKLDNIHSTVASHDQRIGSLESGLTEVSQRLEHSEAACSGLSKNNESLQVKVSDLEGRSRMFTSWVFLSPSKAHVQRSSSPNFLLMFSGIRFWILESPPKLDRAASLLRGRDRVQWFCILIAPQVKDLVIRESC